MRVTVPWERVDEASGSMEYEALVDVRLIGKHRPMNVHPEDVVELAQDQAEILALFTPSGKKLSVSEWHDHDFRPMDEEMVRTSAIETARGGATPDPMFDRKSEMED